jgi:aryl-alcohol dehydrogenase-like predicted oxidoreductase
VRIALGSAQFGSFYGVANRTGQVDRATVAAILRRAESAGMDTLDTAIAYGDSERRLGEAGVAGWRIVSKLPEVPDGCQDVVNWVSSEVQASLARLGIRRLAGLLLHRPQQLLEANGRALWAALQVLLQDGIVGKIGFSIYDPVELDTLWRRFRPGLIQAPYNILDRRLCASGWLDRMYQEGVEVHARSVFLQGLLLMQPAERHEKFKRWAALWALFDGWLKEEQLSALEACLRVVLSDTRISRVIVGVDSLDQLDEILASSAGPTMDVPAGLICNDLDLVNPSRWSSL